MGSTGSNDFCNQLFSRLLQGRLKHLNEVLVLNNQQQRWQNPTPNQQMKHFLHRKTEIHLKFQHMVQCNYIVVVYVYIIEVYMLLAVFMFIFINSSLIAVEFHFPTSN